MSVDSGTQTTSAVTNLASLAFTVSNNVPYQFEYSILFRSAATTNGIKLGLTTPAFNTFAATARIPVAADGVGGELQGWLTTSGDMVVGTGVQAVNTTYMAWIDGTIVPSANGTLQPQFAGELNTSTGVTVKAGSWAKIYKLT